MEKIVLLVEDDYVDAISFERALKKLNIQPMLQIAKNGQEALDLLRSKNSKIPRLPDVIILDLNMPRMNGLEFLEELRASPEFKKLPVFITTTSSDDADVASARKLGIAGYIIKPLNFEGKGNKDSAMDNFNLMLELLK